MKSNWNWIDHGVAGQFQGLFVENIEMRRIGAIR